MIIGSSSIWLSLLSASSAWASTLAPSAGAGGTCLSFSEGSSREIYTKCCGQTKSGRGFVDGVQFSYTCERWALPRENKKPERLAGSAKDCARLCANAGANCPAASWAGGKCYFVTSDDYSTKEQRSMLLLEKTRELVSEPEPESAQDCTNMVDEIKTQCEKDAASKCETEKTALQKDLKSSCAEQAQAQCQSEKEASLERAHTECEEQKAAAMSQASQAQTEQCNNEKASLASSCEEQKAAAMSQASQAQTEQCSREKTALINSHEESMKETEATCKADIANQLANTEARCTAEKQALQSSLNQARLDLANSEARLSALNATHKTKESEIQKALEKCTMSSKIPEDPSANDPLTKAFSVLQPQPYGSFCDRYNGQVFTTTSANGNTAKWKVQCNQGIKGHPWINRPCPNQSIVEILKSRQDNKDYRGLFLDSWNNCHEVIPQYGTWKGQMYFKFPYALRAYIERQDFTD
ncbi:hypothetical protein N7520_001725 [Penicillium odoratum]|uniref:uncharacterized protein n=1 Tax=Penicillium odoratum TaxID=1167516 RepID=UPI002546DA5C|nr:uncharacterized protein N7520_001725 [Penicillium odoratum]KAJ5778479.1 hypothetical protein N7520_001725 [Penicillium odoratum]